MPLNAKRNPNDLRAFRRPIVAAEIPVREVPSTSFADLVRMVAEGIADAQVSLDKASAEMLTELAGTRVDVVRNITEVIDEKGNITYKNGEPQQVSLLELGMLPTFYQFSQATVEVAMDLQIVESEGAQDKILYSANTKELLKFGWPEDSKGSLKSLGAAYLGGFLLGKKAKELDKKIILDLGLIPNTKGSRIYAAVKGVSDSGIKISYDERILPLKERVESGSISAEAFNKIKEKIK